jgi:hypothetical protein
MLPILARPASTFSSFGELIAQPPLTTLARVETSLGNHLVRAEILRIEIDTLRQEAEGSAWHFLATMAAVGLLIGAVVGLMSERLVR